MLQGILVFNFKNLQPFKKMVWIEKVKNCGIDFRWNMFGMTIRDADNLAMGMRICKRLKKVKIHNSKIDDDKFYAVFDGVKGLPMLGIYMESFLLGFYLGS